MNMTKFQKEIERAVEFAYNEGYHDCQLANENEWETNSSQSFTIAKLKNTFMEFIGKKEHV
jgi:hypothetical protein